MRAKERSYVTASQTHSPINRISFLDNAYAEYCQAQPWHRNQRLQRFVRSVLANTDVPGHIINTEDHLVARIRETAFYHLTNITMLQTGQKGIEASYRQLTPNLSVEVVYDTPDSTQSIPPEQLSGWKITLDKTIEIGIRNLKASTQKPMRETVPGFYEATWSDDYDSARLLLIDMIKELKVKGKPVALAPNKATLVVTGSDDIDGLKQILKVAQAAIQQPRLMTLIPLILENGHWTEYLPPQTHPLH